MNKNAHAYFVSFLCKISSNVILFAMVLWGCSAHQYVTTPHYVPTFTKKGELKASVFYEGLQIGYSLSNKFLIYAGGHYKGIDSKNSFWVGRIVRSGDSHEVTLGTGYFSARNRFTHEVLVGAGAGRIDYSYKNARNNYEFSMNASKVNAYIQPDLSFIINKDIQIGVFSKFNVVRYHNLDTQLSLGDRLSVGPEDTYFINNKTPNLFFIEPGFLIRGGWKHVKFNLQCWRAFNATGHEMHYRPFSMNLGIVINADVLKAN